MLAVSDALDGFLARWLKAQTELGKVLDPLADKVMLLCGVMVCVYKLDALPEWFLYLSVARDLFLLLGAGLLTMKNRSVPSARLWGKVYTFYLSFLIILCLLGVFVERLFWLAPIFLITSWLDYSLVGLRRLKSQTFSSALS
ncbi:MAG: CDP-alcohol phosphatidyltransferase family protein [Aquificaceae bacterium]|nr:CDP-alcohol phosphatidyltransferase family protein [Aquificaceae bacterium]